ncbi:peptide/nickel transport system permease protein [Streptacidiphilus jiangxiensis]|uniref:Peptide/nickel transport system permease protein n=1 Tax=Streptacidiphilus jiangxiensis TaxID=235985 RepID=A0A1H7FPU9_STRJI|nr:peptide/nickel transport system permease protein [Streptacidiphilus jiangxiensis]
MGRGMGRFLLKRAINYLILTFIASTGVYFLASYCLEPAMNLLSRHPRPPMSSVYSVLASQNLDPRVPVVERYWTWLTQILFHGNFGTMIDGGSVNAEMGRRIFVSTELLLLSTLIGSITGVMLGAWNALRQYRPSDRISTIVSYAIIAMPVPVIGITLRTIDNWMGSPIQYTGLDDPNAHGVVAVVLSNMQHLILPTLTLWLVQVTLFSRYQRSTMLDVLNADFLRTARAKGLPFRKAIVKHGLRTAVIPVMPLLVYNIVLLFVGATFTEKLFGWHGMGEWTVDTITTNDINSVAAIGVFTSVLVLIAGLLSDLVYAALDPRVRV